MKKITHPRSSRRNGHVTVEMAIILPLTFGLFLGAVELTRINATIHAAETAAYEGAREAILPGAKQQDAINAARTILDANLIGKASIDLEPNNLSQATESVTVTVMIPLGDNSWGQAKHGKGKSITKSCTLTRETSLARSL